MVVFAVHTNKLGFKSSANFGEDSAKSFDRITVKYPSSILGDEDQMNVQLENAMSTVSDFTCNEHRPMVVLE